MAYSRTTWINGSGPALNATNLNNIEAGIAAAMGQQASATDYGAVGNGTTNDTAAIQAAIDAVSTAGGGTVLLPPGNYSVSTLKMRSYVTLRGTSRAACKLTLRNSTNGNVIELFSARQEQIGLRDFTIEGNKSNQSAGHGVYIINDSNTNGAFASGLLNAHHFIDNLLIQNCKQDGIRFDGDTLGGENHISNVFTYACDRYGIYAVTPDSFWDRCVSGQSGEQGFYLESPNSRYVNCKSWFSGRLDSSKGDGYYLTSGKRQELIGCEAQDNKRHGFVLISTQYAILSGCVADSNGTSVSAAGYRLDGCTGCYISGLSYDRAGTPTQLNHLSIGNTPTGNLVDLACGPFAAGGANINGTIGDNSIRALPRTDAYARVTHEPVDRGWLAESMPIAAALNTSTPATAGRVEFAKVRLPVTASVTNVMLGMTAVGVTLTSGQCFAGLYTGAGSLLAQTADQAANWVGAVGVKTMALAGGAQTLAAGDYYVAWFYNGTTSPTWLRSSGQGSGFVNAGTSAPNFMFGSADTGRTTTLPGTMGTQTGQGVAWWVGLS
jgi:Pectate lyase superfamily protein